MKRILLLYVCLWAVTAASALALQGLAERHYSEYEVYNGLQRNESAGYYQELRTCIDTTNVDWQQEAGNCDSIAIRYFDQGEWDLADKYFQKALAITVASYGAESAETADCYFLQGVTYSDPAAPHGELNVKACERLEKALEVYRKLFGEESQQVAECYKELGLVTWNEEYYGKALNIYSSLFGEESSEVGILYTYYAHSLTLSSDYDHRIANQDQMVAEETSGRTFEHFPPDNYDDFNNHLSLALSYNERALSILSKFYDDDAPLIIRVKDDIENIKSEIESNEKDKKAALIEYKDMEE